MLPLEDARQAVARGEQSVRDAASHAHKDRQAGAMHLPIAIAHKEADAREEPTARRTERVPRAIATRLTGGRHAGRLLEF